METKTIATPKFTKSIEKIITEISVITDIDEVHAEVLEKLLQDELRAYYAELEDYYVAISSARNEAYYEGHSDGYARGYDVGRDEGRDEGLKEGYTDGQDYGYSVGHSEGYSAGYSVGNYEGYYDGRYADQRPRQP